MNRWEKLRAMLVQQKDHYNKPDSAPLLDRMALHGQVRLLLEYMDDLEREEAARPPAGEANVSYYAEGDVLYITLPGNDETAVTHDHGHGILTRQRDGRFVGMTIVDASGLLNRGDAIPRDTCSSVATPVPIPSAEACEAAALMVENSAIYEGPLHTIGAKKGFADWLRSLHGGDSMPAQRPSICDHGGGKEDSNE